MDGWVDGGWVDGGWMMDEWIVDGWMDGWWMDGWVGGGWMDDHTHGWMTRWTDGYVDTVPIESHIQQGCRPPPQGLVGSQGLHFLSWM